jgi:glycosyltransferase involved in cell wall biosynthesis
MATLREKLSMRWRGKPHRMRRKLKVAHLTSVHVASDTRILYRECATLAAAGYEVVLIATDGNPVLPPGVRLRSVGAPNNRVERMTRTVWRVYRAALDERADVYHFHDPELMGVGLLLRMHGASVIFDVHEDIPYDIADKPWIAPGLRPAIAAASAAALRAAQGLYSAIVTATPAIARRFRHARTVVVCNYPALAELPPRDDTSFADRPPNVVYLGSISQLRCAEEMVRAMASAAAPAATRLQLAGSFESDCLERRLRALTGADRVDFLGYCPRARIASLLTSARAGLLLFRPAANHDEAVPNKLFEYLGAGLPVIISNTMQCSSIVAEHGCGIVVDPSDTDQIARAIAQLVNNPAEAQAMGERGRTLVRERFEWTSEATKLTQLYAVIA